jgi:hypothetical protein
VPKAVKLGQMEMAQMLLALLQIHHILFLMIFIMLVAALTAVHRVLWVYRHTEEVGLELLDLVLIGMEALI